jgi:hypothetical protein
VKLDGNTYPRKPRHKLEVNMIMSLKVTEPVTRTRSIWLRIWISVRVLNLRVS